MKRKQVVVVGAGAGGLSSALLLAHAGCEVCVVERQESPGGKLRQLQVGGHGIDSGPTVLTMRWVLEELFGAVDEEFATHIDCSRVEKIARHRWRDGSQLDLYADLEQSVAAVAEFAGPAEAENFRAFSDEAAAIYAAVEAPFIRSPQTGVVGLIRRSGLHGLADLWKIRPYTSVWQALRGHFVDPRLRQLFGRYAGYCGASPFQAPATLMLVAHVERQGVWLVAGGMYRIVTALTDLFMARGGRLRLGEPVSRILTAGGRATGVELASGERLSADAVVLNADVAALNAGLFGPSVSHAVDGVPARARSMSAVTWSVLAETGSADLLRHNVFFSDDYAAEFADIFRRRRTPVAPTVYVCAQDRDDLGNRQTTVAERLLLIVNAPAVGDQRPFSATEVETCRHTAFEHLARCGLELPLATTQYQATTPSDFNRLFPATGGALYGRVSHGWRSAFRRPGSRTRIAGLYCAGGSTHPGPGVPMALLSGRLAAMSLLEDFASISP